MLALPRPVLLSGDVYTSAARTPWGGTRLVKHFAKRIANEGDAHIGESWELSLGPELPSRTASGESLAELIERRRDDWLGPFADRAAGLLVKLLDTDAALSLQIHPRDEDAHLAPGESGKPEAWYVVRAEPDAWIAFGWREGVGASDVRRALSRSDGSLTELLQRVSVRAGDSFIVDAGTPHAIGPGVTLVEPQYVARGKRGVTYRYWDWDRRYDARGALDPSGEPRALHVEEALRVTDWDASGADLLTRSFRRHGAPDLDADLAFELLAGQPTSPNPVPSGDAMEPLASEWLRIVRVAGTGAAPFFHGECLHALTVLEGSGRLLDRRREVVATLAPGTTIAIPARHDELRLEAERLHAIRTSIEP